MVKKDNKGITLIALIITIIVLLILAGVTMSFVVGDNGVIKNVQKSKVEAEKAQFIEDAEMAYVGTVEIEDEETVEDEEAPSLVLEKIKEELEERDEYKGKIKKVKNDGLTKVSLKNNIELRLNETKEIGIDHLGETRILCRFIWSIL